MTVQELKTALTTADTNERPLLLDVREPWEWHLARIDGSQHLPMREIPTRVDDLDKSHPTVVICHHGVRSLQVIAFLQRQGFANLHNLHGGIDAWARNIDPAVPVY
ncbi:MAG: sulfurtransferase [Betaproteobacteria bacterium]|nr:sulfurtransferase [Betaproteobacteria bacterium]